MGTGRFTNRGKADKIKNIENHYNKSIEEVKEFNKKQMVEFVSSNDIYAICSIPKGITFVNGLPESDEINFYKYVTYGGKCYHETPNCSGHFLYKKHMFNCKSMAMCKKCGKQEIVIPNWFENYRNINDITSKYDVQLKHYMKM